MEGVEKKKGRERKLNHLEKQERKKRAEKHEEVLGELTIGKRHPSTPKSRG